MFTHRILKGLNFLVLILLLPALLSACDPKDRPVKGFVLPPGDVELGKQVFIDHGCFQCHLLPTVDLPRRAPDPPVTLEIGGKVYRVKDYGELLDAVVNPNHIISPKYKMTLDKDDRNNAQSPMPNFNEEMTVAELIDLVAFLHAQYIKTDPPFYNGYHSVR
jgi:sulfur-oxidizing protein SoxX